MAHILDVREAMRVQKESSINNNSRSSTVVIGAVIRDRQLIIDSYSEIKVYRVESYEHFKLIVENMGHYHMRIRSSQNSNLNDQAERGSCTVREVKFEDFQTALSGLDVL
jgi:hypothetical protein